MLELSITVNLHELSWAIPWKHELWWRTIAVALFLRRTDEELIWLPAHVCSGAEADFTDFLSVDLPLALHGARPANEEQRGGSQ